MISWTINSDMCYKFPTFKDNVLNVSIVGISKHVFLKKSLERYEIAQRKHEQRHNVYCFIINHS